MKYYFPDDENDTKMEVTENNIPVIILEMILLIVSLICFVAPIILAIYNLEHINLLIALFAIIFIISLIDGFKKNTNINYIIGLIQLILLMIMFFIFLWYMISIIVWSKFGIGIIIGIVLFVLSLIIVPYTSKTVEVDKKDDLD